MFNKIHLDPLKREFCVHPWSGSRTCAVSSVRRSLECSLRATARQERQFRSRFILESTVTLKQRNHWNDRIVDDWSGAAAVPENIRRPNEREIIVPQHFPRAASNSLKLRPQFLFSVRQNVGTGAFCFAPRRDSNL